MRLRRAMYALGALCVAGRVGRGECCIGGDKMYPRAIHVDACGSAKVHEWKHHTLSGWDNDVHQHVRLGPRQPERSLLIQRHDLQATVDATKKYLSFTTNSPSFTVYVKGGPGYDTYNYTGTAGASELFDR